MRKVGRTETEINEGLTDKQVNVTCAGVQFVSENDSFTLQRIGGRADYHIVYMCKGELKAEYDGKYVLMPGDFILYPPNKDQNYEFSADIECSSYWVHFGGTEMHKITAMLNLNGGVYYNSGSKNIEKIFRKLIYEENITESGKEELLLITLLTLISENSNEGVNIADRKILKLAGVLESRYNEDISIKECAEICGLSAGRTINSFKKYTGFSPHQYQINFRISKAKHLLMLTNMSISEIAYAVGYDDYMYFSRIFKAKSGYSPTSFRKIIGKDEKLEYRTANK